MEVNLKVYKTTRLKVQNAYGLKNLMNDSQCLMERQFRFVPSVGDVLFIEEYEHEVLKRTYDYKNNLVVLFVS